MNNNTNNTNKTTQLPSSPSSSSSSLLFSIEQWELIRRLRNSGVSKDDICSAFDELDRVERDLGPVYDLPLINNAKTTPLQQQQNHPITAVTAYTTAAAKHNQQQQQQQNQQQNEIFAKNFHLLLSQAAATTTTNTSNKQPHQPPPQSIKNEGLPGQQQTLNDSHSPMNTNAAVMTQNANNIVNTYFANIIDSESENKQIEELRR